MIIRHFELKKFNKKSYNLILLHGKNEGLQKEVLSENFTNNFDGIVNKYDESDFIYNFETILSEILNKSLFDDSKIIIVSRVSDKILKNIEKIIEKNLVDVKIILKSGVLEKKSKLRNFFEKSKILISVPFYDDNLQTLANLANEFLRKHEIKISRESLNLLVNRSSGSRDHLKLELEKILYYSLSEKNIDFEIIQKLSNLAESHNVSELADNYLAKNQKNVARILNENNYSNEDCILIIRTILNKSKRLLNIVDSYENNKNLDEVISSVRPPIFWKDKDMVKKQATTWKLDDLKKNIYKINEIEAILKTNSQNSLNLISDFIVNY